MASDLPDTHELDYLSSITDALTASLRLADEAGDRVVGHLLREALMTVGHRLARELEDQDGPATRF